MRFRGVLTLVAAMMMTPLAPAEVSIQPPIIPREVLFGNPDRTTPRISPDGSRLGFLAPLDGVLNVWVAPLAALDAAAPVTRDTGRGIRDFQWAFNSTHVIYAQDKGGDENWHIFSVDVRDPSTPVNLTPYEGVRAEILASSPRFPSDILVAMNKRDPQLKDVYRVNLLSGETSMVRENDDAYTGFVADDTMALRIATRYNAQGGTDWVQLDKSSRASAFESVAMEDTLTTAPLGFDASGKIMYAMDSRGRDTAAAVAIDLATKESTILASDDRADVASVLIHPVRLTVQAVSFTYDRQRWKILDESIAGDFAYLKSVSEGDFTVPSRSLDDALWVVSYVVDNGPTRHYLYDRAAKKARFLFPSKNNLEGLTLARMYSAIIPARDGLQLVAYCSLPPWTDSDQDARPDAPLPMVLLVHGGPWARDSWGYNATHQWLANRGYAVLSVNFRGSTGFGKSFINAGNLQWAAKMHDDLLDAVNWAVAQGIADTRRVAIMGGSYGGYATLVGLTFTPERFAAGVSIVGPSNLVTLLNTIPPYWAPVAELFKKRVGDHTTAEGRALLQQRSPLTQVDKIQRPLLIGQGANDPRVKRAESDQIVSSMREKNIPVTYILYPDEGHGFARPENRRSFNAVAESFLARHLGGRYEPVGKDFEGSSIRFEAGGEQIPGMPGTQAP